MTNLYDQLGIKKTSDKEKIKKAYRKKAKKSHPDVGGKAEEFGLIATAYKILIDDAKRERFDNGESPESILKSTQNQDKKSQTLLMQMFASIVLNANVDTQNVIKLMKERLEEALGNIEVMIRNEEGKKKKFESVIKRLKGKNNLFKDVATSQIAGIARNIETAKEGKKDFHEALKFLEDFSYQTDDPKMNSGVTFHDIFTGKVQSGWI